MRRLISKTKNHKKAFLAFVIAVLLLCAILILVGYFLKKNHTHEGGNGETDISYLHISYGGKDYTYNSKILTLMYIGIDSEDGVTAYNRSTIAPLADTIELLIFDELNYKINILLISRDTIASVNRYTMDGDYRDKYETNIGYAYSYGDGGRASAENLMASVRKLFNNIPIHEYAVTDISSLTKFNDLVGGVTVTVPNDDLVEKYPELTRGAVVTLSDENVEDFVRYRDTDIPYTNNGRMERQRAFSIEFYKKLVEMICANPEDSWLAIEDLSLYYETSISRSQYFEIAGRMSREVFEDANYYTLTGENAYDEDNEVEVFYVDEDNLMETLIALYYIEDK